jgi:hypothetical protein
MNLRAYLATQSPRWLWRVIKKSIKAMFFLIQSHSARLTATFLSRQGSQRHDGGGSANILNEAVSALAMEEIATLHFALFTKAWFSFIHK